jgi:hypothetical protein
MDIANGKVTEQTVRVLLQGANNIDRMKVEIKSFVGMILGLLREDGRFSAFQEKSHRVYARCIWDVNVTAAGRFFVTCRSGDDSYVNVYSSLSGTFQNCYHIQKAHSDLPILLKEMINWFPSLKRKLRPFISAAEAQF